MLTETLEKTEKASLLETEKAISFVKKVFESKLRSYLNLTKDFFPIQLVLSILRTL